MLFELSKDGQEYIWGQYNPYGRYFGGFEHYNNHIYVLSYDDGKGVVLIELDQDGNFIRQKLLQSSTNNSYVYAGEMFIRESKLYYIHKGSRSAVESDTDAGPLYLITFNLETFTIESKVDYDTVSQSQLDYITENQSELISEQLNKIYDEAGYETFIYQQIIGGKFKYYIGTIYNETAQYGIVVKTDMNNKISYVSKSQEPNMVYYDATYLGGDYIAVSGYVYSGINNNPILRRQSDYPSRYISKIKVLNPSGEETEVHDINSEIQTEYSDIISLNRYKDAVVAQATVIKDGELLAYTIKYHIEDYGIEREVKGSGTVEVQKRASKGEEVTFKATPTKGYVLGVIKITDTEGNNIEFADNKFIMPESDVIVYAEFIIENPETGIKIGIISILIITIIGIMLYRYSISHSKYKKIN